MLSEQIMVSSGALFVRAAEGAAAAGFIFNVLMVARAPLVLFQAIAASLLPHLTRLRARGDSTGADAFRMSVNTTLLTIVGFAAATTLGVLAIGPEVMQLAFGDKFSYDRVGLAIVAVGMGFYLSAAALNQAALAQGQARRAALCWVDLRRRVRGLEPDRPARSLPDGRGRVHRLGGAALGAALPALLRSRTPSPPTRSSRARRSEIEARLAAVDEIG